MKFINKIFAVVLLMVAASACDNLDLDLQDNPNVITPEKASLNELYNSVQLNFGGVYLSAQGTPGASARMYHAGAFTYRAFTTPNSFNGLWSNAYTNLFPDVDALVTLAEAKDFDIHAGTAKIMKAYTMLTLVDLLGDVPFSEVGQGTTIISPKADPGQDVYTAALALLDEAIAQLNGTTAPGPDFDNFFDGDPDKWITVANTLKLRAALNTGDVAAINGATNFIDEAGEDFQINFGSQRTNPNSRHPFYNDMYETNDGAYMSNYYMWTLKGDKQTGAGVPITDPRVRYYFYRKIDNSETQDPTTYGCHFSTLPDQSFQPGHWADVDPRIPYCYGAADGYIGRDHLNGEGIPPDGPVKTSYGLYPGGGDFDDDTFNDTRLAGTTGGLGRGIAPILLSSFVDFMRAEAVLRLGATGDARALLTTGIRSSLDKVESLESIVADKMNSTVTLRDGSTGTVKFLFGMSETDKQEYIDAVLAIYDAAATDEAKLAVVIKEYYIAAWGNGLEAYNMYRRTGYPDNMQPGLEENSGEFPLSFFYPVDHVTRNSNVDQKPELNVPVFWQDASIAADLY